MAKVRWMLLLLLVVTLAVSAPWATSASSGGQVPAYNAGPPAKGTKLPPILGQDQLWGEDAAYPYQTHAYALAAKIPVALHQQPCYCYCDRMGHKSLHTCFEGTHGARCGTSLKELYYAYLQSKKGRTAAQIRTGIIAGEWQQVDLQTAASIK